MKKIITTTEFVQWIQKHPQLTHGNTYIYEDMFKSIRRYVNFITQPITLDMFINTDENGELLNRDTTNKILFKGWKLDTTRACLCIKRGDVRLCLANDNLDKHFLEGGLEKLINTVDLIPTDYCLSKIF